MFSFFRKKSDNVNYHREDSLNTVEILSPPFFGIYASSPNRQYAIAWADANISEGIVGYRKRGRGIFCLLSGQNILLSGKLQRPNDGAVANNGTFVISDYLFTDKLAGRVYVFDSKANLLLQSRVKANLLNSGISDNGLYICFQTCCADHEDGNSLFVYDVGAAKLISQITLPCSWASSYKFDEAKQIIHLIMANGRSYRIAFDGSFLDKDRWTYDRECEATGVEALELAKAKFSTINSKVFRDYEGVNVLLNRALSVSLADRMKARVNRLRGEIYLNCDDINNAIKFFEIALSFDEKVGIKAKLVKLKELHK